VGSKSLFFEFTDAISPTCLSPCERSLLGLFSDECCARCAACGPLTSRLCFRRRSREESSELTNVGALKLAETLQQSDALTKQSVITFRCSRLVVDVARLLVERRNLTPQFVGHFQSRSKFVGLRPKYRHSLARSLPSFPLVHYLFILSCADSEFRCRTEDSTAIHDGRQSHRPFRMSSERPTVCLATPA
jgi:hypothetical protein